jgi:hypothetical protein
LSMKSLMAWGFFSGMAALAAETNAADSWE